MNSKFLLFYCLTCKMFIVNMLFILIWLRKHLRLNVKIFKQILKVRIPFVNVPLMYLYHHILNFGNKTILNYFCQHPPSIIHVRPLISKGITFYTQSSFFIFFLKILISLFHLCFFLGNNIVKIYSRALDFQNKIYGWNVVFIIILIVL